MPGATGNERGSRNPEPSTKPRKRSPSDQRRDAARAEKHQRRGLETAVRERHEIRNERNPLARRHMPAAERHIAPDELPAKDWTRKTRVDDLTVDVEHAYRLKRGEAL